MSAFHSPTTSLYDKPLPPPFIDVPPLLNLREVSGYPTSSNGTIKPRILYRCANPTAVPLEGIAKLHSELGIGRIFDLRSGPEIANQGGLEDWEGRLAKYSSEGNGVIEREYVPVFPAQDMSPEALAVIFLEYAKAGDQGFVEGNNHILSNAGPAFSTILRYLASLPPSSTSSLADAALIHCTAGKDRTGMFFSILLSLLGVSDDIVSTEYALTEIGMAPMIPIYVERMMASDQFKGSEADARRMVSSSKVNMLATLVRIRKNWGSAEGYVKTVCGLSEEEIAKLKLVLVEGGSE